MRIIISLLMLLSTSANAQVYHLGKNVASVDGDYVNVTWVILPTSTPAATYWVGAWAKDTILESALKTKPSVKKIKLLLSEFHERGQLRDSTGKVLLIPSEVELFNLLSKSGFEFVKKDAQVGDISTGLLTNYLFRRKPK